MVSSAGAVLLGVLAVVHAAKLPANRPSLQKRDSDTTNPGYVITYPESTGQIYVETIKSLSPPSPRYLPSAGPIVPINVPSAPAIQGAPISVTFDAFEAPSKSTEPAAPASSTTTTSSAPSTTTSVTSTSSSPSSSATDPSTSKATTASETTSTSTSSSSAAAAAAAPARKRPSGGLGSFTYYGGSSASSGQRTTSTSTSTAPSTTTVSTVTAASVVPTVNTRQYLPPNVQVLPAIEKPSPKPVVRNNGYDYPSPKNARKPTKKEQKLADSKPEESEIGYRYEIGLPSIVDSTAAIALGGTPVASSGMGLSYMRQSSPFFSYHVMLD